MNEQEIKEYLENLVKHDLGIDSDNAYRSRMQLQSFNKEEYNRIYGNPTSEYGGFLSADEYVKELRETVEDYEKKKQDAEQVKAWLHSR